MEEGFAVGRGDGAGDVGRETLAGGDGDGGGGEFEFGLVENHGVGAGFYGGRGEGPGGDGFGPVLGRGVEPVHDALHAEGTPEAVPEMVPRAEAGTKPVMPSSLKKETSADLTEVMPEQEKAMR